MNICFVQPFCIPGGPSRPPLLNNQQILATSLVKLGHQVHIITLGDQAHLQQNAGVHIHRIPVPPIKNRFSSRFPHLDEPLTYSQAVYERLLRLALETPIDIVELPLWMAIGLVTLTYYSGPVIVYLLNWPEFFKWQARPISQVAQLAGLERECLKRATAVKADSDAILIGTRRRYGFEPAARPTWVLSSNQSSEQIIEPNDLLARQTVNFYNQVCRVYQSGPRARAAQVIQIVDALEYGDAVSNIARRNANLLAELGSSNTILSLYAEPRVARETKQFDPSIVQTNDGLIVHYWGYSKLEGFLRTFRGPKALHYHNITPPHYFPAGSHHFQMTNRGYEQLQRIANWFDLIIGDSNFNLDEYARFLTQPKPTIWLPPVIAPEQILAAPFDRALYRQLRAADQVKFLFVGRIARNKRQDRIMHLFDYYYREINRHSQLWLVGNYTPGSDYFKELQKLREELASGRQITFSGKIADEAVQAYYRAADVFVSASEHEGFGVPLLEAMVHGLPVVAFAATAVPETVNKGGILIQQWDSLRTAELINLLLKDQTWQTKLIAAQQHHLRRFSEDKVRQRLTAIVDFLCHGIESPFFTWRGPNLPHQNVSSSL